MKEGFYIWNSDHGPLDRQENDALFKRLRSGDSSARDEIVAGNVRLVLNECIKFRKGVCDYEWEDMVSVGLIGLMKAIDTFDPDKGYSFSTYAIPCIRTRIRNELRTMGRRIENGDADILSLDFMMNDGETGYYEFIPDEEVSIERDFEARAFYEAARKAIEEKVFTRNERKMLRLIFGFDGDCVLDTRELRDAFGGVTRMYISDTRKNALRKLRKVMREWQ